jgi:DNA polymerase
VGNAGQCVSLEVHFMRTLSIDIETYSATDLKSAGVYKYVEDEDFQILLFAYAYDDEPVRVIDMAQGEDIPASVVADITSPHVLKTAFNANFEITCLRTLFPEIDPDQWECTMIKAGMLGLPMSLDGMAKALKLDNQKMAAGKALIRYFSVPCKPTIKNGGRTRNLPHHDLEKWELFKKYCGMDVEVERDGRNKMDFFSISDTEHRLWVLDQQIVSRGVLIDQKLVKNAIRIDAEQREILTAEARKLTGLENPNSGMQLRNWLSKEYGRPVKSLAKGAMAELLENSPSEKVTKVLKLNQELSKTSTAKYQTMLDVVCKDGRAKGLLQFYGANRTGRWAGRKVQLQNLPQNHLRDLDLARKTVLEGDRGMVELLYGNVADTLSQLIRTALVAPKGSRFIVADYSAIEARVIAWLAGEKWRNEVFATHGKIYEASASQMFGVPVEKITKDSPLRQKGKIAELALGYQGGVGAMKAMGGERMGLSEEEMQEIVYNWRAKSPAIVKLWRGLEEAATAVILNPHKKAAYRGIKFFNKHGILWMQLPSGRCICYVQPKMGTNRFGSPSIVYMGIDQMTRKWTQQETYGGKLTENCVQAIARDCLAVAMLRLAERGYQIVMHVHDEIVVEEPYGGRTVEDVCSIMAEPIEWAKGLLLPADGYETDYYKKD